MDIVYVVHFIPLLARQLPYTLSIIVAVALCGTSLAFIITVLRIRRVRVISQFLEVYISFVRCIPSILLLFLVYYGLPYLTSLAGNDAMVANKTFYAVLSLTLFNGGYMSEVMRPAYLSVERDQWETADSLGYNYLQKLIHIIIPQALPVALPEFGNALINIMKDTSLLFTIGIVDITGQANIYVDNNYGIRQTEIYLAAAAVYWACALFLAALIKLMEKICNKNSATKGIV
ncbi:MAG: amino acid ABC transporter permease [Sporolactobacillus sp.]|nr:amino acid ABC transporter permease [Sporolactobacillus sp.]